MQWQACPPLSSRNNRGRLICCFVTAQVLLLWWRGVMRGVARSMLRPTHSNKNTCGTHELYKYIYIYIYEHMCNLYSCTLETVDTNPLMQLPNCTAWTIKHVSAEHLYILWTKKELNADSLSLNQQRDRWGSNCTYITLSLVYRNERGSHTLWCSQLEKLWRWKSNFSYLYNLYKNISIFFKHGTHVQQRGCFHWDASGGCCST